jgi:hypothetical protein
MWESIGSPIPLGISIHLDVRRGAEVPHIL